MRIFEEEQSFRQWWVAAILGLALIVCCIPLIVGYRNSAELNSEFIGFGIIMLVILLFWVLKLRTRIDATGISAKFEPLSFFSKKYKWNEISKCYVRKYAPIQEYGGWGVRGFGQSNAYNVSGNIGIQIETNKKKRFLIGTNKPEEAQKVLKYYQQKLEKNE